jgi:voltage-gated potassium channel
LTTTGYGDVTLRATTGRLLASVMMIVGVSLFLRLVQVLFRTARLPQRCASCGLSEHETDASLPPLWNAVAAAHDINRSCS